MDRRLHFPLFPVVAITASAQQPSPAAAEAEKALQARVQQFYQLQIDRKFRQAEALVAEESKDDYYNRAKQDIRGISTAPEIEFLDNNSRARVRLKAKVMLATPFGAQEFEMPLVSNWKVENGQWFWYIDPETVGMTPFGRMVPPKEPVKGTLPPPPANFDAATLMNQITVDRTAVTLTASSPVQTVTVSNNLPGEITLELTNPPLPGISVEVEKANLKVGEKSSIRFRLTGDEKSSGVARIVASPLNKVFEIQIN